MKETIVLTSKYYKPHFGGVENSLFFLAKEYVNAGKNVIILCSDASLNKKLRLRSVNIESNINIIRYKRYIPKLYLDYLLKPFIDIYRIKKKLRTISKEFIVNNVIARSPETALSSFFLGFKTSYLVPGIIKTQDYISPRSFFDYKSLFINNIVLKPLIYQQKKALSLTNVFVFSENMKYQVVKFLQRNIKIKIVKPGVDSSKFKPRKIKRVNKIFVFLIVGRLVKDKSIDLAIKSFSMLNSKKSRLLIIGEGPEEKNLRDLALELNVNDRILFKGKITKNIESYYRKSDCFLMSSTREPFGQTIIEALAVGLPILAWKKSENVLTATHEIITNNRNGFLIDYNVESMSDAMLKIINLSEKQKFFFFDNNIKLINEKYQWKNLSQNLIK